MLIESRFNPALFAIKIAIAMPKLYLLLFKCNNQSVKMQQSLYKHILKHIFFYFTKFITLMLMKGDKVVEVAKIICNALLFFRFRKQ